MALDFAALDAAVMEAFAEPEPVLYRPRAGQAGPFPVPGIFDRAQVQAMDGEGATVSVRRTTLGVREADFPPGYRIDAGEQGDRLQLRGLTFAVKDAQPDGQGWVYLDLARIGAAGP